MNTSPDNKSSQKTTTDESISIDPEEFDPITGLPANSPDFFPSAQSNDDWPDFYSMDNRDIVPTTGLPVNIDDIMPFDYDGLAEISSITSAPNSPRDIRADGDFWDVNLAEIMDGSTQLQNILSNKADTEKQIDRLKESLFDSYMKKHEEVMRYFLGSNAAKGYEVFFQDSQMLMDLVRTASPIAIGFLFRVEGVYDCIYGELSADINKTIIQDLTATAVLFGEYELVNQLLSIKHAHDYLISDAGQSLRTSCRTRGNHALCNMIDSRISRTSESGFFSSQTQGNDQRLPEPKNENQYGPTPVL